MKKIITAVISLLLTITTSTAVMTSSAYDYERHYCEYFDENNYYTHNEYKIGTFSDEKSSFSGCDLYAYETVEAYEGLKPLKTTYEYIVVPDNLIGNWFESRKSDDSRFKEKYEVKLSLQTGYFLNMESFELEDNHEYDMYVMWKKVPYIKIITDTDTGASFDTNKANELLPDMQKRSLGEDTNGNYVYYLSTDFDKRESNVETILTKEDAMRLLELKNEHLLSLSYCEEYELQYIAFDEYPIYYGNDIDKATEYFEEYGINFSVEEISYNEHMIVPDSLIPAPEYYELISKIQEETGIMPKITMYEVVSTETYSTEMFNIVKGDVNSDGQFNIADVVTLKNFLLGKATIGINADMNNDGTVDIFDMILIREYFSEIFIK